MQQCIFHGAKCARARFARADLTYSDFSHADVTEADFSGATLFRTRFHSARSNGAIFAGTAGALGDDPELAAAERWKPPSWISTKDDRTKGRDDG